MHSVTLATYMLYICPEKNNFHLQQGITLLLINLDGNTTIHPRVDFNGTMLHQQKHRHHHNHRKSSIKLPRSNKVASNTREEYHLTAKDGNLQSQTMLLNGKALIVDSSGNIPTFEPIYVNSTEAITVAPLSIVFVHIPYVLLPACS